MQEHDALPHIVYSLPAHPILQISEEDRNYAVRRISWYDFERQDEYQRLRAEIFVRTLGWQIPVDQQGRERDHYDSPENPAVSVYGVYGRDEYAEYLLGGVRLFSLRNWEDSMIMNEFYAVGMIPEYVLRFLKDYYLSTELLELTRFCVQRGRRYRPAHTLKHFNNQVARDLTYAAVYAQAQNTERRNALALVNVNYLQVMRRSHFVFKEVYARHDQHQGYVLTVIDLWDTIRSIRAAGDFARANRMLALCTRNVLA